MKESAVTEPVSTPAAIVQPQGLQQHDVLPVETGSGLFFQAKLSVGAPDDPLEKEADDTADHVMRMPESSFIQRKCAHCDEEEKINRKEITSTPQLVQRDGENGETPQPPAPAPQPQQATPPAPLPFHLINPAELQLRVPSLPRISLFPTRLPSTGVTTLSMSGSTAIAAPANAIDWFAMNRPFWNRGAGQISAGDYSAIETHWNYSFQFFRSIGASAGHATFFSNLLVPMAIDSSLQRDNPTWWETTDRELGTSSKIISPTLLRFDLDNLFGTIRPIWDPSNPYQIQRKSEASAPGVASENTTSQINSSKNSGSPMPERTQSFMESRFGYDFSDVRIHTGNDAANMSRDLNAKAFTVGNNIYFNHGNFSPDTSEGKQLLAHELTHTLQQGGSSVKKKQVQGSVSESLRTNQTESFIQRKSNHAETAQLETSSASQTEIKPDVVGQKNITGSHTGYAAPPPDNTPEKPTSPQNINIQKKEDFSSMGKFSTRANFLQSQAIQTDIEPGSIPGVNFIQRKCAACDQEEKIQRKESTGFSAAIQQPLPVAGVNNISNAPKQHIQRNAITSALGSAWDATGGRVVSAVGDAASSAIEWVEDQAESIIERIAPGLLDFLRGDIIDNIKNLLARAVDAATGGLFSRLQAEGLQGILEDFISSLIDTVSGGVERGCQAFAVLAQKILDFIRSLGGAALQRIRAFFQQVGSLLSSFWNNFALPIWDAIKAVAGTVWEWITSTAAWLWELIRPIRETIARAWNWLMRQFGIAWRAGGSVLDWIKGKAEQAWNWLMEAIEPIKTPLMVIGGILLMLSPLGPVVAIGAGAYAIYRGVQWVRANWNSEVFVRFRAYLQENILDVITAGIETLKDNVVGAFNWVANTLLSLQEPIVTLLENIGTIAVFRFIQRGIQSFANTIRRVVTWAGARLTEIGHHIINVARDIWEFIRPYAEIVAKLAFLLMNPWLIPIVLAAWAWRVLPDCFKPPIINFVIQIMISALQNLPNFKLFGDTWPGVKLQIIQFLQRTLATEEEEKVAATNRVARMVSELDLELISNQIQAARLMPGEFEGQMEEELLGADLTAPLPFERTEEPTLIQQVQSSGVESEIAPEDMSLFQKSTYTQSDIDVDQVAPLELEPELVQSILRRTGSTGGEVEFGNSTDGTRTVHDILGGMLPQDGASGAGGAGIPAVGAAPDSGDVAQPVVDAAPQGPPLSREEETESRLQEMMAQSEQNMLSQACNASQEHAGGQAEPAIAFPEAAKFGPLSRGQRARYTLNQMYTGLRRWFNCNSSWLIPTIIGTIVLLVVAEVLTGGAVTAALPVIMEAITTIMIGVAVVRGAYYLGEYVYKSIAGDIIGAAKSLARSIAVAAVEAIFALLGSDAFWKSLKSGAAAVGRVVARAGRAIGRAFPTLGRAGRAILSSIHAVVERGRLIMRGIGERAGRGMKTLDEFAERLFSRVRFRRFRIRFERRRFRLEGYINPWILLATGDVEFIEQGELRVVGAADDTARLGDDVFIRGGRQRGIVVGVESNPRQFIDDINSLSQNARRDLQRDLRRAGNRQARRAVIEMRESTAELRRGIAGLQPGSFQAHHVIPRELRTTFQDLFDRVIPPFNIEDGLRNGIMVPPDAATLADAVLTNPNVATQFGNSAFHLGSHPNYTLLVETRLTSIRSSLHAGAITPSQARVLIDDLIRDARASIRNGAGVSLNNIVF
ncbi:DUF4157 domain-containing protein [Mucilaginibacter sp.]|uniref:eCIS core domain-containing protein n=1 Tax=Mucilaginibacter sp. TaxID=1882438 RepID=UPI0025E8644F|nr:DUF4157 domain-containing protein [Mucilaginibacter sp.]